VRRRWQERAKVQAGERHTGGKIRQAGRWKEERRGDCPP